MKKIKELSLILSGVVLGLGLSFSPQIYAATSELLGSTVTGVFTIEQNGKKIADSAIINGSAYVPVRVMAEATGTQLAVEGKVITLGEVVKTEVESSTALTSEQNAELARIQQEQSNVKTTELNRISKEIRVHEKKIELAERAISLIDSDYYKEIQGKLKYFQDRLAEYPYVSVDIERYKADLDKMDKEAAEAKVNIPIFKANIADLEAQLAALSK